MYMKNRVNVETSKGVCLHLFCALILPAFSVTRSSRPISSFDNHTLSNTCTYTQSVNVSPVCHEPFLMFDTRLQRCYFPFTLTYLLFT